MLRNLLKYEFKATARIFIPIYIAILLVSIVNRLFRLVNIELAFNLTVIVLVSLFIALGVLTIIGIVQRFNKNLLSDEGYLMFTLPVSPTKLIVSKLITSVVWTIVSGIAALLSFTILVVDQNFILEFNRILLEIQYLLQQDFFGDRIWIIIQMPFVGLMSYIGFILMIYLSLATAQLPKFNKHRGIISFVAFFILSTAIQWITVILSRMLYPTYISEDIIIITTVLIGNIILNILLFIGTDYILKKHLNLE
ncbi:hypothetical protein [Cellulosilyticum sp. I15G10I2]|uniref:hypothetical protein n=1 Tax=Cellulosilyticum sp. I15G10I2 TaxID=1892843 RepID=UPI00085C25C2|nr:hypothetical protein [Cellulosilyticum sp. I15G10I2]